MKITRQSLTVFLVILALILLIGVFCYTQLEIVPSFRWKESSREVRANDFYALEKWLAESGRPVRSISAGNINTILTAQEKTIFIENSSFNWNDNPELLIPWLENGGRLIISLNSSINYRLESFMETLGVKKSSDGDEDKAGTLFVTEEEENSGKSEEENKDNSTVRFDWDVSFKKAESDSPEPYKILVMNTSENTKLVKFETGRGFLIFTGVAYFLHNYSLRNKQNVNLAAEIFLNDVPEEDRGVLFIRTISGERHLLGNLAERGNPAALIISLVLLIITGFWMSVPLFGRSRPAPERPGKPLRERFLAEGRFLKKNNALGKYIEIYEKELEQRNRSSGIGGTTDAADSTTAVNFADTEIKEITFVQFINEQKKFIEQFEKLNREII